MNHLKIKSDVLGTKLPRKRGFDTLQKGDVIGGSYSEIFID
jgi:hypothetical protein